MTPQEKVNHIQGLYRQWLELEKQLEQAEQTWKTALKITKELERFYFDGEYSQLHQAIEDGLVVDLTTEGEYSVMSEDALWNAFADKDHLLWNMLRLSVANLDRMSDQAGDE